MNKFRFITFILLLYYTNINSQSADPAKYVLERDQEVAKAQPGPHNGGGNTIGYSFFENVKDFKTAFRKRVLKPGSAIGYHLQKEDEIYYILSGTGIMQMNGETFPVQAGDAVLTRPGSSHGLVQSGTEDLVILIVYKKKNDIILLAPLFPDHG
ncbi:MAG: cupin domain-containing protein [Saprospiraceae bacterium]